MGKSVLFNKLTGLDVGMANYPGTTVDYKKGTGKIDEKEFTLVDAPGTYTLDASNEAEQVAVDMLNEEPRGVVCVLDAKNLESSLYLLLQALEKGLPTVAVINKTDLVEGSIDIEHLSKKLGIPILETAAVKNQGISKLKEKIVELLNGEISTARKEIDSNWKNAEQIFNEINEDLKSKSTDWREKWGKRLEKPYPGIIFAILIIIGTFLFVVGVGLGLRNYSIL